MTIYYLKFCLILSIATANSSPLEISLQTYNNNLPQTFNYTATLPPNTSTQITVSNLHRSIKLFVIQTHSLHPTTLSNTTTFTKDTTVSGTNIGLLQLNNSPRYQFYAKNPNDFNSTILILIVAYPNNVPIPGGCNMEYAVETAPYQMLNYTDAMVTVDAQAAALEGFVCESALVNYKMYLMFLPELDNSSESYFEAIMKMATPEGIEMNGYEIHKHIPNKQLRRLYSSYRGTGAVYALIAYNGPLKSAYVPIATYACDTLNWDNSCENTSDNLGKVILALLFFVGIFLCFHGHQFFKSEVFLVGALLGSSLGYLIFSNSQFLGDTGSIATAVSIGILSGLAWFAIWYIYGIPLLTVTVVLIVFGFIISAIIFQAGLGDINIFVSDLNYWSCLCCICLMTVVLTIGFTHKANILASSAIGALICALTLDYYIGSYLKYIFINIVRRANVQDFGYAVLHSPIHFRDGVTIGFFFLMLCCGLFYQLKHATGRPPFAPSPYHSGQIAQLTERTPLLVHETSPQAPSAPNYRLIA